MRTTLSIWVVYDHPRDHPDVYVARRFAYDRPTNDIITTHDLTALREDMMARGLTCITRSSNDDAKIMETWL